MVVMKGNFWNFRGDDGLDRSHVPPTPIWIAIIRVVQLLFALLTLILVAVGASYFGSSWASVGIAAFTFALTLIHIGWLAISILAFPIAYNYWAQLGVEIACVIFWLATWASLAADGSALGTVRGYRDAAQYNTAAGCIKGAAGVGALTWLLFVATLVFFVISLIQYRKAKAPAAGTTGPEAGEPKPGHELSQVSQQPQAAYAQPDQYGQQVPPQHGQTGYVEPNQYGQQIPPQQQYQQQPYQGGQPQ
ncbi:hypothetical protein GGTG_06402 [Gaeumannomyces tritici R3-111a-1]|uniref:MARVEL domain-containing protein n=1 Tax=Gaeumannomyces tritici (strain R3-111a-1) TaxID=644352 RepID=J3NYQ0_GAET3|nr:hypothetical protein GGTG_06402 [Gaeumannomyces tritici R3-111a-1]EJT76483.1 hypothetical protein GGTG_06402 [Gaeumannomyces tritici R3-111a-1]